MIHYIESPTPLAMPQDCPILFLAGGITNCPDWQKEAVALLGKGPPLIVLNPRRAHFPIHNSSAAQQQITWEFEHLAQADMILFWFPCETLCPIVLYELGRWGHSTKPLFVGTHPNYKRRHDVQIQMHLARPDIGPISNSLPMVCARVVQFLA